jgi:hypothetical protein
VLAEALNSQNPAGRGHSKAVGCMLSVSGKTKTEIRAYEVWQGDGIEWQWKRFSGERAINGNFHPGGPMSPHLIPGFVRELRILGPACGGMFDV